MVSRLRRRQLDPEMTRVGLQPDLIMFERYTERARRTLFFARYEAIQFGSMTIETEHLLLGLVRPKAGLASLILADAGLSPDTVRHVQAHPTAGERLSTSIEIPFSVEVKRALGFAAEEADRLHHGHIGTEHLLLGLIREERSMAAAILRENGLELQKVRDAIVPLLKDGEDHRNARE